MRSDTAYNHFTRLKSLLRNNYSIARSACMRHEEVVSLIKKDIYSDPAFNKLPAYIRSSISEIDHYLFNDIQTNWVIWMHLDSKGKQVFWEELNDEERASYVSTDRTGDHYWIKLKNLSPTYDSKKMKVTKEYIITKNKW